jgi:hypothetical protein
MRPIHMGGEMMDSIAYHGLITSPFGGEVARSAGEGAFLLIAPGKGPFTRPKRADLSPQGEVTLRAVSLSEVSS